jgi:hypothetical protein
LRVPPNHDGSRRACRRRGPIAVLVVALLGALLSPPAMAREGGDDAAALQQAALDYRVRYPLGRTLSATDGAGARFQPRSCDAVAVCPATVTVSPTTFTSIAEAPGPPPQGVESRETVNGLDARIVRARGGDPPGMLVTWYIRLAGDRVVEVTITTTGDSRTSRSPTGS